MRSHTIAEKPHLGPVVGHVPVAIEGVAMAVEDEVALAGVVQDESLGPEEVEPTLHLLALLLLAPALSAPHCWTLTDGSKELNSLALCGRKGSEGVASWPSLYFANGNATSSWSASKRSRRRRKRRKTTREKSRGEGELWYGNQLANLRDGVNFKFLKNKFNYFKN